MPSFLSWLMQRCDGHMSGPEVDPEHPWDIADVLDSTGYCYFRPCKGTTCWATTRYWVGQKVHQGFSIRCYGKT